MVATQNEKTDTYEFLWSRKQKTKEPHRLKCGFFVSDALSLKAPMVVLLFVIGTLALFDKRLLFLANIYEPHNPQTQLPQYSFESKARFFLLGLTRS